MRRRNDYWNDTRHFGFLWDDKSQDIVREKESVANKGRLTKIDPFRPDDDALRESVQARGVRGDMDKPNSRYRVGTFDGS